MLLGYARGSVGDLVFSRQKGQQVTKARNRTPYNPKSNPQTDQRANFTNAVKFFTRGVQNLFKFAFEDKSPKESDFNAFMRNNQRRSVMISKTGFEESTYPALGKWLMSKGSLNKAVLVPSFIQGSSNRYVQIDTKGTLDARTVGKVSTELINTYNLQRGDIVTIVTIRANGSTSENTPAVEPTSRDVVKWSIYQMAIEPTSDTETTKIFTGIDFSIRQDGFYINLGNDVQITAVGVIFSRKTKSGLKVSTCELYSSPGAQTAINLCSQSQYIDGVRESWQTEPNSILQGSVNENEGRTSPYSLEVFVDQACTIKPQPGQRVNELWARINKTPPQIIGIIPIATSSNNWQKFTIANAIQEDNTTWSKFDFYDGIFESNNRLSDLTAGKIIVLRTLSGTAETLGNGLITEFKYQ